MHEVRFKTARYEDDALRLLGDYFQGRVSLVEKAGVRAGRPQWCSGDHPYDEQTGSLTLDLSSGQAELEW